MIKLRYVKVRLGLGGFEQFRTRAEKLRGRQVSILRSEPGNLVARYTVVRHLNTIEFLEDGTQIRSTVPTMEQYSVRFFESGRGQVYISLLDPPRGSRLLNEVLDTLVGEEEYFVEPLELGMEIIATHTSRFNSARLVSAKVRDFRVYENAVGRLEVTSKEGLPSEIAPFLHDKFHRIDSLTYEITHDFERGLITYISNGTVRIAGPIAQIAFPSFEETLP